TVLTVGGDVRTVSGLVTEFFAAHGWTVHERGPGRLEVETGSRRRTVLLGAFAGSRFHLSAPLGLRELPRAVDVRYRWGARAGPARHDGTWRPPPRSSAISGPTGAPCARARSDPAPHLRPRRGRGSLAVEGAWHRP